jgi:hydroxymethylbilane synthase
MKGSLRIGTRGSALALWQAEHVATRIRALPDAPPVELVTIQTEGDRIQDVALSQLPGKAFFTKELEEAMLDGRTDLAVHSLKDVPTAMPSGLELGAVLEREDPRDALIARPGLDLDSLPRGARIGTSSLRRSAFLRRWRRDLEVLDLRGNVPTRLGRLDEGRYDAIVLAAAGLKRLGLESRITGYLPFDVMLPAVSQGAIAIQLRSGDERVGPWVRALNHEPTRLATTAERALLREVEGGCQVPLGAHATVTAERLELRADMASLDGSTAVGGSRSGVASEAVVLGRALAEELMAGGGAAIMNTIRGVTDSGDPSG